MLTRRDLLGLLPGAAAMVMLPPLAAAGRLPTAADYKSAWQKLAEAVWAPRMCESSAWMLYEPYNEWGSMMASGTRLLWDNPKLWEHPADKAFRDRIGALIATGRFWPLHLPG